MPATEAVRVLGLRELQLAFKRADKAEQKQLRESLKRAGEPVRLSAQTLAVQEIRNIGIPWSRMRVGVTTKVVYVAPVQKGRRSRQNPSLRRRNLAPLLMNRAMLPALQQNRERVVKEVEKTLDTVGKVWER